MMTVPSSPCITLAYATRPEAESNRRELRRNNLLANVSYCGTCDSYHLTADVDSFNANDIRILELIAQGYTWKECVDILGVKYDLIKTRMYRLMKRFYATNQTELISIAIVLGIIDARAFVPALKERNH